ncbi:Squamosa promoter binding-like protein [Quillaja saponaria]|uniref:Squamosa promoter binding-like protein n=1 Tax=Quillaja saponaria TaxID=32244 RepID=A0AAD7PJM4_QUISA|nr:Squamosa promoter binding-like protein [Quillaja saponaria]
MSLMEETGAQVASPIFHQNLSTRFCVPPSTAAKAKKRDQASPSFHQQSLQIARDNWNPKIWDWDSVRFLAKPLDTDILRLGTSTSTTTSAASTAAEQKKKDELSGIVNTLMKSSAVDEDDERIRLNLGVGPGGFGLSLVEKPTSRPNKRVRSGSPGGCSYPICQVDSCTEDLSNAKDYHRRHKVCEVHSKSTKALVAKQMQRFCQQCSRFHLLSEFDEGKRSCRRRLAGHNRRRRKTQAEDVTSQPLISGSWDDPVTGNLDIVNILTAIAHAQGKIVERSKNCSQLPDRDRLVQILNRINSLPLPTDLAAKLPNFGSLNGKVPEETSTEHHNKLNGNTSSPLTMDLLAVLSTTLKASSPDAIAMLSQNSSQSSDSEKSRLSVSDLATDPNLQMTQPLDFASVGGERSSTSCQSPMEDSDCQVLNTRMNLPLQLFSSSPEDDTPPKLASSRKYFSSDSSNPVEERSPSSSFLVGQKPFTLQGITGGNKSEKISVRRELNANIESSQSHGFDLFRGSTSIMHPNSSKNFPFQAGYASSWSDQSPSSLNSDAQDRTGRIMFKLFDKDPSHFPGTLRTQIYNWLSNGPSEMESYIRPGCVILSVYVSMSVAAWEQLEENLIQSVNYLIQSSDSDFWRNGRFLVHTGRQFALHKDGRIRLCKPWRTSWRSPELISVSPLAIISGEETSLFLKGRNLTNPGTKIHCTNMGGYTSKDVTGSTYCGTGHDEINLGGFKIHGASHGVLGRCFIEVENGLKGNCFPLIVADATICKELRLLESEFDAKTKACDVISEDHANDFSCPRSREEVLHFLNELGWLFQKKKSLCMDEVPDYSLNRFKFLLTFSVEHNFCTLVRILLDMLVEENLDGDWLSKGPIDMLCEIQLLNQAVKRRFIEMVDLLIHYSITRRNDTARKYVFPPNLEGPGGITPLHLAASTLGSDDMIDVLTNDPQEIALNCWNSLLDANGQTPYAYAAMRNNHSYNTLVARKLADRRNGLVSLSIENEIEQLPLAIELTPRISTQYKRGPSSCAKCTVAAMHYNRKFPGSQGLLRRPYILSMLAIAAVCVCVCLFLRGAPDIGLVVPFKWENLDYGTW